MEEPKLPTHALTDNRPHQDAIRLSSSTGRLRREASHMDASRRQLWVRAALLLGAVYFLIGRVFALPSDHVHEWRLAAWMVSGVAYAAHIGYEHFRLRNSPRLTALHVAVAVAIGHSLLQSPG